MTRKVRGNVPRTSALLRARGGAEEAGDHGDLAGVPDSVADYAFEHGFVGIAATGNLLAQIFEREIAKVFFEEIAALIPTGEEFAPEDGRLGPFFFGLPKGERIGVGSEADSFIPEEQMLEELRNRVRAGN